LAHNQKGVPNSTLGLATKNKDLTLLQISYILSIGELYMKYLLSILVLILTGCADRVTRFPAPNGQVLADLQSRCDKGYAYDDTTLILTEEFPPTHTRYGWKLEVEVTCSRKDGVTTKFMETVAYGNTHP
jgi:hypothetical protein